MTTLTPLDQSVHGIINRPSVSAPRVTHEEIGTLFKFWMNSPQDFAQASSLLQEQHFGFTYFAPLFLAISHCLEEHGELSQVAVAELTRRQIEQNDFLSINPQQNRQAISSLTENREGSLIYDSFHVELSRADLQIARDIQQRFIIEKTIFDPAKLFFHPNRVIEGVPENINEFLNALHRQQEVVRTASTPAPQSVAILWDSHEDELEQFRGRERVGIATGFTELDRKTLGLRGVVLLGAAPGTGKTAFCFQAAYDAVANSQQTDTCAVLVSLEMSSSTLMTRLKSFLTQLSWQSYVLGTLGTDGSRIASEDDLARRRAARQRIERDGLGNRLVIADRETFSGVHSASTIASHVSQVKTATGATRALIIIDYLQLLDVPDDVARRGDREVEKYQLRIAQEIVENSKNAANPIGDTVIAISEARKPTGDARRNHAWGQGIADLMGSARLGYGADVVLTMRRMTDADMTEHYSVAEGGEQARFEQLESAGVAPVVLSIEKGRDGMTRGIIPMEFDFLRSTLYELRQGVRTSTRQVPLSRRVTDLMTASEPRQ